MNKPVDKNKLEQVLTHLQERLQQLEQKLSTIEALAFSKTKEILPGATEEVLTLYKELSDLRQLALVQQTIKPAH